MSLREAMHRVEEGLIALILGVMTILTFIQVVLRYVFNSGLIWQLEANFYLFAWLVMIGMSYCVRVKAHIGVDAAVRLLSPTPRRVVGIFVLLLALLYTGLMIYGSFEYINRLYIINVEAEDIPVATWKLSLCLPIGFLLLLVRLLEMGWRIVTGQSEGYELADEAKEAISDSQLDGARGEAASR
ncbi:MAG: TRAP transporter small permease [Proteobacteria bacterium]|nr:TRAP transporter small permease [Pseudomonadota bacterium]